MTAISTAVPVQPVLCPEEVGILNGRLVAVQAATAELFVKGVLREGPSGLEVRPISLRDGLSPLQEMIVVAVRRGAQPLHSAPELAKPLDALQRQAVERAHLRGSPRRLSNGVVGLLLTMAVVLLGLCTYRVWGEPLTQPQVVHPWRDAALVAASVMLIGLVLRFVVMIIDAQAVSQRRRPLAQTILQSAAAYLPSAGAAVPMRLLAQHVAVYGVGALMRVAPRATHQMGWHNPARPPLDDTPGFEFDLAAPVRRRRVDDAWTSGDVIREDGDQAKKDGGPPTPELMDDEQIAILNGRLTALQTAVASLVRKGAVYQDAGQVAVTQRPPSEPLSLLEGAVVEAINTKSFPLESHANVKKQLGLLQKRAVAGALLRPPRSTFSQDCVGAGVLMVVFTMFGLLAGSGVAEQGIDGEGRDLVFAVFIWLGVATTTWCVLHGALTRWRHSSRRTDLGSNALRTLRSVHPAQLPAPPQRLGTHVALYGPRALFAAMPAAASFGWALQDVPPPEVALSFQFHSSSQGLSLDGLGDTADAWCSGADACGSSGCGGDGGGCGGCGGCGS